MALGLLGARGERHVRRRRSACDRLHSCGVWLRPRVGGAEAAVVRSGPEEEELTGESPVPEGKPPGRARQGWWLWVQEGVGAPFPVGLLAKWLT